MKEFFTNVPKVEFEGTKTKNPMAFRYYNPDEVIAGKKMRDIGTQCADTEPICSEEERPTKPLAVLQLWRCMRIRHTPLLSL